MSNLSRSRESLLKNSSKPAGDAHFVTFLFSKITCNFHFLMIKHVFGNLSRCRETLFKNSSKLAGDVQFAIFLFSEITCNFYFLMTKYVFGNMLEINEFRFENSLEASWKRDVQTKQATKLVYNNDNKMQKWEIFVEK